MSSTEFYFPSIQDYQHALKKGATSCVTATEHYLAAIREQSRLNAYVEVYADEALQRAQELDEKRQSGKPTGRLHGVVIGIKDVLCYKGHAVTAASRILKGFTATYHATVIEKLLAEDAIIIGSLNCDEFAMGSTNENSAYGNVLNSLDETRVPGGSSGGSAVAVQANLCMVSLGSDTGGSVRQPADFCGIVGLKPSYGRVSRYGLIAYASSFDQVGIFGRNVPDVATVLEVIAGPDEYDSTVSQVPVPDCTGLSSLPSEKFKLAYFPETLEHPGLDPEIAATIRTYIDRLPADQYEVKALSFDELDYVVPAYYVLTTAEASSNLSRYDGVRYGYRTASPTDDLTAFYKQTRSEGFGKEVKRRIMLGSFVLSAGYYDAYFTKAQQVRKRLLDKTREVFENFNAIILPTVPSPAFKFGEKTADPISMYLADIYTVFANLTGIPAISIPLFTHSNGMPFGLQIMTSQFSELSLLKLSHQMMCTAQHTSSKIQIHP